MYAIVEIAGQQFNVSRGTKVYVNRLEASEGSKVEFDKVLLIDTDGKVQIGTPSVDGAKVAATVLSHLKGDKVIVFKKKRRKGYQKSNGHRQQLSQILIQGVLAKGETLKDELVIEKKAPVAVVEETIAVEAVETKKVSAKKAVVAEKKPAKETTVKKAPAKKAASKKAE